MDFVVTRLILTSKPACMASMSEDPQYMNVGCNKSVLVAIEDHISVSRFCIFQEMQTGFWAKSVGLKGGMRIARERCIRA